VQHADGSPGDVIADGVEHHVDAILDAQDRP
jgi:hypothetical protein